MSTLFSAWLGTPVSFYQTYLWILESPYQKWSQFYLSLIVFPDTQNGDSITQKKCAWTRNADIHPKVPFSFSTFCRSPLITRESLVAQWLNCSSAAKTLLMSWGSIAHSWLKVDSAFHPSEVHQMSTQLTRWEGQCVACISNCKLLGNSTRESVSSTEARWWKVPSYVSLSDLHCIIEWKDEEWYVWMLPPMENFMHRNQ